MRNKREFAEVAREMGTTTQDLFKKYQQQARGLKANEQVRLDTAYEMRRAWNPFKPGLVAAFDECKVKKLLPKPKFEFKKADLSQYKPVSDPAQPTPPPDVSAPPARS